MVRPAGVAGCQSLPVASRLDGGSAPAAAGPATRLPAPSHQSTSTTILPATLRSAARRFGCQTADRSDHCHESLVVGVEETSSLALCEAHGLQPVGLQFCIWRRPYCRPDSQAPGRYSAGHAPSHGPAHSGLTHSWRSLSGCLNQPTPGLVRSTMRTWSTGSG